MRAARTRSGGPSGTGGGWPQRGPAPAEDTAVRRALLGRAGDEPSQRATRRPRGHPVRRTAAARRARTPVYWTPCVEHPTFRHHAFATFNSLFSLGCLGPQGASRLPRWVISPAPCTPCSHGRVLFTLVGPASAWSTLRAGTATAALCRSVVRPARWRRQGRPLPRCPRGQPRRLRAPAG